MESEDKSVVEFIPGTEHTTLCEHSYVAAPSDPKSNLRSAVCLHCWNGISYDPETHHVFNGLLTRIV